MQVETFEVLETDHETGKPECDAEAVALIESLGLEGQQTLIRRREGTDGTSLERMPYRKMTKDEAFVYRTLCPKISTLHQYADGPIPLRVLQVAAHARDMFDRVEVWSAEDADVKDPVLVGIKGKNSYDTDYSRFILARWGEVLEPYSLCMKQAAQRFRDAYKAKALKIISEMQGAIAEVDSIPDSQLVSKSLPSGYC